MFSPPGLCGENKMGLARPAHGLRAGRSGEETLPRPRPADSLKRKAWPTPCAAASHAPAQGMEARRVETACWLHVERSGTRQPGRPKADVPKIKKVARIEPPSIIMHPTFCDYSLHIASCNSPLLFFHPLTKELYDPPASVHIRNASCKQGIFLFAAHRLPVSGHHQKHAGREIFPQHSSSIILSCV